MRKNIYVKTMTAIKERFFRVLYYNNHTAYARSLGVSVGNQSQFMRGISWGSEPYLISIGNHVMISSNCSFVNHDGCVNTVKGITGENDVWKYGKIVIGNNVSIGTKCIILPGVHIGDNSIVGAGSVVTKSIPEGEVWAGNPARFIKTTDEYVEKIINNSQEFDMKNYRHNKRKELSRKIK